VHYWDNNVIEKLGCLDGLSFLRPEVVLTENLVSITNIHQ